MLLFRFQILFCMAMAAAGVAQEPEPVGSTSVAGLPAVKSMETNDWLVDRSSRTAGVFRDGLAESLVLDNGYVRRTFLLAPNLACIGLEHGENHESLLRGIRPECIITLNGKAYPVGGLTGQRVENFLQANEFSKLKPLPDSFVFKGFSENAIEPRFEWKRRPDWISREVAWPPPGRQVTFHFEPPTQVGASVLPELVLDVHYEIYDGLPLICKWFTIHNASSSVVRLNTFVSEQLACVEASSQVEDLAEPRLPNIHVETDFTTCSMQGSGAQRDSVYWTADPKYETQVNYKRESLCLLECRPLVGPEIDIAAGETFSTFRTWLMPYDSRDEVRQCLSLCRMYSTIAPWTLENPLMHHVRSADPVAVRLAIDQCAEVGFELVIMTFGSGFDIENESPDYLDSIRELADYAHSKGIALGGYSLLASRSVSPEDDVVNPATGKPGGFARFGNSPCLESRWGQDYFRKLYQFFERTGCDVLEHDGSYPGDACASNKHPGHEAFEDSRWRQWETVTTFYQWCRGRGVFLNVPDWYFLHGSSKTGMGYRETNWSLPRAQQELIERQNIHDGTRFKLPTMGWMFVPLTEYHGGGAEATIEPLSEHLEHYERRLQNLFGAGVQACFRGPRIFDTDATREIVHRWVTFYKDHRPILDSPLISLRRADGRDWDGWLHVNPRLNCSALMCVYNPLDEPIERLIRVPLYYAGLRGSVSVSVEGGLQKRLQLDEKFVATINVTIPPNGMTWLEFRNAN